MDVKPVSQIQSSIEMNVQNITSAKTDRPDAVSKADSKDRFESKELSPEMLEELVKELKKKLSMLNTQLKISIDKDTDMVVVKVIDKETKEVIRQIPPEYVLKIVKYLDEITGLLYENRV